MADDEGAGRGSYQERWKELVDQGRVIPVHDGHGVQERLEAAFSDQKVIRFGLINEEVSVRVVLVDMKLPDLEEKDLKKIRRPWAAHPEKPRDEYFPFLLVKFNESNCCIQDPRNIDCELWNDKKYIENFRRILQPFDRFDAFRLEPPKSVSQRDFEIVHWDHGPEHLQVSKKIYEARSKLEVQPSFLEEFLESYVDGKGIFYSLKAQLLRFVDISDPTATMVALWIMATHIHQIFSAFPYCYLWAERGSGKSRVIKIAALTSHVGELVTDPTAATISRGTELVEWTLCIDEAENQGPKDAPQLTAALHSGYERGPMIPRYDMELKQIIYSSPYCPKIIGSINGPAPTLESRCLRIPLQRTKDPERYGNMEPYDAEHRATFDNLQKDLVIWAIDKGSEIAAMDRKVVMKKYASQLAGTPARLRQLLEPVLILYEFLELDKGAPGQPSQLEALQEIIRFQSEEKKATSIPDDDARILVAVFRVAARELQDSRGNPKNPTMAVIIEALGLETKEEQKHFSTQKVGRVLGKYMVPKRIVNGRAEYWPGRNREQRLAFMDDILARYQISVEAVEETRPEIPQDDHQGLERYGQEAEL